MFKESIKMSIAYIGLGSNIGDRITSINRALDLFREEPNINVLKVSPFYETEPLEFPDQNWFINAVAEIETNFSPDALLRFLISCEDKLQRNRSIKWGPRSIDLDILFYDNDIISNSKLQIPHLRMHYRAFVLAPLSDINPYIQHPILNKTSRELLEGLSETTAIRRVDQDQDGKYVLF